MSCAVGKSLSDPRTNLDNIARRFWSKAVPIPEAGCWLWEGVCRAGYGQFGVHSGMMVNAHRLAYWLTYGPFDERLDVLHRCDVPSCVNPAHLWLGTHTENMHDMLTKDRWKPHQGEAHGCAKLNEAQVKEIRRLYRETGLPQWYIAKQFGVSQVTVGHITRRDTWSHVN